jgi:hypothetical protein
MTVAILIRKTVCGPNLVRVFPVVTPYLETNDFPFGHLTGSLKSLNDAVLGSAVSGRTCGSYGAESENNRHKCDVAGAVVGNELCKSLSREQRCKGFEFCHGSFLT